MKLSLLALIPAALATPIVQRRSEPAPLHIRRDIEALIADQYIVKYYDVSASSVVENGIKKLSVKPKHLFKGAIRGFAAKLDQKTLDLLRDDPNVEFIEQDAKVQLNAYVTQSGAPWGLARLSSRSPGASNYTYDNSAGAGTCSYIIDSGIEANHSDFSGRASQIYGDTDGNGHGTHVAGIIGSNTYGVAKRTTLLGVKVLNDYGSGSYSDIIAGIDFVISDARSRSCPNGAFVNMSLGGDNSATLNAAAYSMIQANIFVAVSAGNRNTDAADYSPANEPSVCTVGATNSSDGRAAGTNYGSVIDIFAPGQSILSTYIRNGTRSLSGTSMASPHVAGLAAYLSGLKGYNGALATCQQIIELATTGLISDLPGGTPNRLVFNGNPSG
ncbi:hypothetical protein S40285_08931 [Stachybotrys chlorohalonatus IBT 40285]|uniref:Peptidase S8/S53 domain-containing protein n=1 Tax=Stachybotrys chlorohalonatus (strain IBT 40285) TaxID=1283841 RepID=A0A084Q7U8_STAC4|nr:hypothetical protein S40285_08931 [Stachybotrys chlorohalonata IBT 40285]